VTVGGRPYPFKVEREGDIQRVRLSIDRPALPVRIEIVHTAGTDVSVAMVEPSAGAASEGLRVIRVEPEGQVLRLLVEGRGQRTYRLSVHGPRSVEAEEGVTPSARQGLTQDVAIHFAGPADAYTRRDLKLRLK
jgi:hypothetical protein